MSVIAITGFPKWFALRKVAELLGPVIRGQFKVLNFDRVQKNPKTCYILLSEELNPHEIALNIKGIRIAQYKLQTYMPPKIENLPLSKKNKKIEMQTPVAHRLIKINPKYSSETLVIYTHEQILLELQSKYTGLYDLNKKFGNRLLEAIGQTVLKRLQKILKTEVGENCKQFSRLYRMSYPHSGDFHLIMTTVHRIQDELGRPRIPILERELIIDTIKPYELDKIPPEQLEATSEKFSDKIIKRLVDHVSSLTTTIDATKDPLEEDARVKVREQLKNMIPYFPSIIKDAVYKHVAPQKTSYHVVKVYGEPKLPGRASLSAWMRRFDPLAAGRSDRMYNLLLARVHARHLRAMFAADGTVIGESKLVVRPADTPYVKIDIEGASVQTTGTGIP